MQSNVHEPLESDSPSPNQSLLSDVRNRVESFSGTQCVDWGGQVRDGRCEVTPFIPNPGAYAETNIVRSAEDALVAFDAYTEWFEFVLSDFEPQSDSCVLLPCGAMKPIGSSAIHQKKLEALSQAGLTPDADIMIISEPCTVVPHHWRLHRPPVNYDFPPEFTEESVAPSVFDVFTDRIAEFIDSMPYRTYYPYLVAGHQKKFDTALAKAESSPRVIRIPGSSIGLESEALSGDLFKSTNDIVAKLEVIRALKDGDETVDLSQYPDDVIEEYARRSDFTEVDAEGDN